MIRPAVPDRHQPAVASRPRRAASAAATDSRGRCLAREAACMRVSARSPDCDVLQGLRDQRTAAAAPAAAAAAMEVVGAIDQVRKLFANVTAQEPHP